MNSIQKSSENDGRAHPFLEDEIDIKLILYSLNRNKRLIAKFIFSSLFLSSFIIFSSKTVWEGEFQIVLENNEVNRPSLFKDRSFSVLYTEEFSIFYKQDAEPDLWGKRIRYK